MASTLEKLIAQRDALDQQINELQQREREQVVAGIRETMAVYGITPLDLEGRKRRQRSDKGRPRGPAKKRKGRAR